MTLVVLADDAFLFLFGWELMSLSSWALVMAHQDHVAEPSAPQPGFVYLLMATFSGLTLLLAFSLLGGAAGGLAFDSMRAHPIGTAAAAGAFVLALIGAGSKAGLVPLHVWLPLAHPAAPSHVSALMSGVMTKVAIYGFLRIAFDLLGPQPWWTATLVLALGGITAVLGVLQAILERDLKRLLAYSTVENIGIIFVGIGMALAFRLNGFAAGAALAITAALFHALNHTLFKSLLFFGAGRRAERHRAARHGDDGRPDPPHALDRGVSSWSGAWRSRRLPPLNGFASEWLTFQAVLVAAATAAMGPEADVPGRRRAAGACRRACRCLFRARIRHQLSRPPAHAGSRERTGGRWLVDRCDGRLCRTMPAGRHPAGRGDRQPGAGNTGDDRRAYAGRSFPIRG